MKKIFKLLPLLLVTPLTACHPGISVLRQNFYCAYRSEQYGDSSIYAQYSKATGTVTYKFTVTNTYQQTLFGDLKFTGGSMNLTLIMGGEEFYTADISENMDFERPLPEYGKLTVRLILDNFSGSYIFSWIKK